MSTIGTFGRTTLRSPTGITIVAPAARALPQGTVTRLFEVADQGVHFHANGATAQASQITNAAGRLVFHAAGASTQARQVTNAAGRVLFHAGGATVQRSQATQGVGRLVYRSAGITAQVPQSAIAVGRLMLRTHGATVQARQSMAAAGRVDNPEQSPPEPVFQSSGGYSSGPSAIEESVPSSIGVGASAQASNRTTARGRVRNEEDELAAIFALGS